MSWDMHICVYMRPHIDTRNSTQCNAATHAYTNRFSIILQSARKGTIDEVMWPRAGKWRCLLVYHKQAINEKSIDLLGFRRLIALSNQQCSEVREIEVKLSDTGAKCEGFRMKSVWKDDEKFTVESKNFRRLAGFDITYGVFIDVIISLRPTTSVSTGLLGEICWSVPRSIGRHI